MSYFTQEETKAIVFVLGVIVTGTLLHVYFSQHASRKLLTLPPVQSSPHSSITIVDINNATFKELEQLPGIGKTLAMKILDYRREHGPFTCIDDLTKIKGFTNKILRQVYFRLTL